MIQIPPVGSTLHVTFPKHFEGTYSMKVKIVDVDVKDDPFGTIKYQVISKTTTRHIIKEETISYEDVEVLTNTFSIVEPNWFNEELTGRKITIL